MTPLAMLFTAVTLVMLAVIVITVSWIAVGFARDRREKR